MSDRVAKLALEDGTVYTGRAFGALGERFGEVVFNTSMTGYQEVLTDPSYKGQIVTMTYPHIGNYGVNPEDAESARPQVAGFVVREGSTVVSSWRASGELGLYLDEHGIVGISEVDTRALTRHLRNHGAKRGVISAVDLEPASLLAKARASRSMIGLDLAREVTCEKPWSFEAPAEGAGAHLLPVPHGARGGALVRRRRRRSRGRRARRQRAVRVVRRWHAPDGPDVVRRGRRCSPRARKQ